MLKFSDLFVELGLSTLFGLHLSKLGVHSCVVLLQLHASSLSSISPSPGIILDVLQLS